MQHFTPQTQTATVYVVVDAETEKPLSVHPTLADATAARAEHMAAGGHASVSEMDYEMSPEGVALLLHTLWIDSGF